MIEKRLLESNRAECSSKLRKLVSETRRVESRVRERGVKDSLGGRLLVFSSHLCAIMQSFHVS